MVRRFNYITMKPLIDEQLSDIQIKYVYIKNFTWLHPVEKELYAGHPIPGKVYRAIFNKNTGNWKLLIPNSNNALLFNKLVNVNEGFESEMVELTAKNLLDFHIEESDLDEIIKWSKNKNSDVKGVYEEPLASLNRAMNNRNEEEEQASARAFDTIMTLWHVNPIKFDIILSIADRLVEEECSSHEDPANFLSLHPTDGRGVNISKAIRALDTYVCDNRKINNDIEDLYDAVSGCVQEIERTVIND